jgi:2-keto-myo-inositol isomerase
MLSVELFNPEYFKQDPLEVAKLGMAKLKAAVEKAFA